MHVSLGKERSVGFQVPRRKVIQLITHAPEKANSSIAKNLF